MRYNKQQSGFSLVETLVAITILLLVIVGPMSISSSAARSTSFASEQVTAFFLAQEGAEIAQKARDDLLLPNFLDPGDPDYEPTPWTKFTDQTSSGLYEKCEPPTGCGLELNTDASGSLKPPVLCSGSSCDLYLDSSSNRARYTHDSSADDTPYSRVITMEVFGTRSVEVTSTVTWRTGSQRQEQQVEVKTFLFNVYGN